MKATIIIYNDEGEAIHGYELDHACTAANRMCTFSGFLPQIELEIKGMLVDEYWDPEVKNNDI